MTTRRLVYIPETSSSCICCCRVLTNIRIPEAEDRQGCSCTSTGFVGQQKTGSWEAGSCCSRCVYNSPCTHTNTVRMHVFSSKHHSLLLSARPPAVFLTQAYVVVSFQCYTHTRIRTVHALLAFFLNKPTQVLTLLCDSVCRLANLKWSGVFCWAEK